MKLHAVRALLIITCIVALGGCETLGIDFGENDAEPIVDTKTLNEAPRAGELIMAHNHRTSRLMNLHATGVIELRWQDDDGKHFEQGDVNLWVMQPRRTALRVSKLGKDYVWVGSDAERFWLFDNFSDEKTLMTAEHTRGLNIQGMSFPVRPLNLLDLAGLTLVRPYVDADAAPALFNPDDETWTVAGRGIASPVRLTFDRTGEKLLRVESIQPSGAVGFVGKLDRFVPAEVPGTMSLNWPTVATRIEISDPAGETDITLFLENPSTDLSDEPTGNIFRLDRLIRAHRPDRVEGDLPPGVKLP